MKIDDVIDLVLEKTNIKINKSKVASIIGLKRQSVSRYNKLDFPEKHIRAIENYFNFSLAPRSSDTKILQKDDNIMHVKVPKGTKVLVEFEE